MNSTLLLCTVGGSHEPIITAVRQLRPDYVCFVCSGDDATTGRAGSWTQIEKPGSVIKARPGDDKPSLPNIPAQLGLPAERFEVLRIPADDLDTACAEIRQRIAALKIQFTESRLIADYTGGTKTMTAALVLAALEEGIELQLVTGGRADLIKVGSGMESVFNAPSERIRIQRAMAPFQAAWQRYAYAEAALGFADIALPQDAALRAELLIWRDVSRALDAWDRFDHAEAWRIIEHYNQRIGRVQPHLLTTLRALVNPKRAEQGEALRLYDLWHNAQRRAAQGRFDDAVARVYRLLEWTAQWLLRCHLDIDTADVPAERLPEGFEIAPGADGTIKLGLIQAWRLLGTVAGPMAEFVDAELIRLQDRVQIRNHSILAHGFTPISETEWQSIRSWLEGAFLLLLKSESQHVGIRAMPPQLPTQQCW